MPWRAATTGRIIQARIIARLVADVFWALAAVLVVALLLRALVR